MVARAIAYLWKALEIGGVISFGHWLGSKEDPENPGLLANLGGLVKWIVIGAVVLFVYSVMGKKIKIGK
jgi:hypothetical protein